jgi:ribosome maturation factor RimP
VDLVTSRGRGGGLAALRDRLRDVIAPVARDAGVDLEKVAVSRIGRRHSVQVVVDRDEPLGLDAIAEVSRVVSDALDAAERGGATIVPGEYVLEVSSPGVDRPLTEPRHWRRNVGRLVAVPIAAGGTVTGRVVAAGETEVTLDVDGATRELAYQRLGAGRVQVELRRLEADTGDEPAAEEGGGGA